MLVKRRLKFKSSGVKSHILPISQHWMLYCKNTSLSGNILLAPSHWTAPGTSVDMGMTWRSLQWQPSVELYIPFSILNIGISMYVTLFTPTFRLIFLLNSIPINDPIFSRITSAGFDFSFSFYSTLGLFASLLEELTDPCTTYFNELDPPHLEACHFLSGSLPIIHFQNYPFLGALSDHIWRQVSSLCVLMVSCTLCWKAYLHHSQVPSFLRRGHPWRQRLHLTFWSSLFSIMLGKNSNFPIKDEQVNKYFFFSAKDSKFYEDTFGACEI